ncbi:MAG: hypothetical protein LBI42_14435 [Chitinispirillales bacterium]|jgi:hypothetical protein|nr:hypothetical protein [Chitinispirillales bacterium]
MKLKFDAKKFERDLNNHVKKQIDKIVQQKQYVNTIKRDGQMISLNTTEEQALKAVLSVYQNNESHYVGGSDDIFPKYMHVSLKDIFDKLKDVGLVANYKQLMNQWVAWLTPDAFDYFTDKEKYMEDKNARESGPSHNNIIANNIIIATDNATVTATQNNGVDISQLKTLIEAIRLSIPKDLPKEDIEERLEHLEELMIQPTPKKFVINDLLSNLKTAAESAELKALVGATNFVVAVTNLVQFIKPLFKAMGCEQ